MDLESPPQTKSEEVGVIKKLKVCGDEVLGNNRQNKNGVGEPVAEKSNADNDHLYTCKNKANNRGIFAHSNIKGFIVL